MHDSFVSISRKWLGLLLACLLPVACLVESEDDPLLRINLEATEVGDGFLLLFLEDSSRIKICDLWAGPMPESRRIEARASNYRGASAILVVQEYENPAGLETLAPSARLLKEVHIRVQKGIQSLILPKVDLAVPGLPFPADQAEDVDTLPLLRWSLGGFSAPAPKVTLYFGTSNPPPLLPRENLRDTGDGIGPLRPDQVYFWRIESKRADQSTLGPVWSFRTRPAPPTGLTLPAPPFFRVGEKVRLVPGWSSGTRIRFSLAPPLPEGFRFDDTTGAIEGTTERVDTAGTEYTLEAANVSGKTQVKFALRVRPRAVVCTLCLPDSADRIRILLSSSAEPPALIRDDRMPPEGGNPLEIPEWDGRKAQLRISGWLGGRHHWEKQVEISGEQEPIDRSVAPALHLLSPEVDAWVGPATADFRWSIGSTDPPARVTLYVSRDDTLDFQAYPTDDTVLSGIPVRPDTVHHWAARVEWGQNSVYVGPRRFRTLPLPPAGLAYPEDTVVFVGTSFRVLPVYQGGGRIVYSVTPPLPAGLSLDSASGEISGQPADTSASREYRLRAANATGWIEDTLRLHVLRRPLLVDVPESMGSADTVRIMLRDVDGNLLETFYEGPPPALGKVAGSPQVYPGGPARLHIQAYAGGILLAELQYAFDQGAGRLELLSTALAAPYQPFPADGAVDVDTALRLTWKLPEALPPQPSARLFLGEADPLPQVEEALAAAGSQALVLKPDQVYRWRVALSRGPQDAQSPVWTFRTRPSPPLSLDYSADSVLHQGQPVSWTPSYRGGGRVRYRVQPALPAGLALDSLTGRIEGVPLAAGPRTEHVVTAANSSGSSEARLPIRVGPRLIDLRLPDSAVKAEAFQVHLLGAGGNLLDTLWDGARPADLRVRRASARYDGVSAEILALGWLGGRLVQEYRFAVAGPAAVLSSLPLGNLAPAHSPVPADGSPDVDTNLALAWSHGIDMPPPLSRLYLGTAEAPTLLADSLAGSERVQPLLPDTEYRWRVESLRAGRRALGPVWSFRTRPSPPRSLEYPADTVCPADRPAQLVPAYAGGRAKFRVSPPLPPGLLLDSLTGRISGTPRTIAGRAEYQVTASNASGVHTAAFHLQVGPRLIDFTFPILDWPPDSVIVRLVDTAGGLINLLWSGPMPDDRNLARPAPDYDGGPSLLLVQAYSWDQLAAETRHRVITSQGVRELLPPVSLPDPVLVQPADGAFMEDSIIRFSWSRGGGNLDPPPRSNLQFLEDPWYTWSNGTDVLRGEDYSLCTQPVITDWSCLLTDTVYTWRVETHRHNALASSAYRTFRTRTTGPRSLSYLERDSLWATGVQRTLKPLYQGGRDPRFRVSPPLPAGISLDSMTGEISGRPASESPRTEYAITVSNQAGSLEWRQPLRITPPPAPPRLVARWDLDGDGTDSSGNGYHGTTGGKFAWVDGVRGRAISLAGAGFMRVDVRDDLHLNGFTLSLWSSQADSGRNTAVTLLEYSEPGWLVGLHLGINTHGWGSEHPGDTYVNIRPSDALPSDQMDGSVRERNILWATEPPDVGTWTHHVVTFDPDRWQARIYLNGVLAREVDLQPGFLPLTRGRICLGYRPGDMLENMTEFGYHGLIDQVEIYDGPLDPDAVQRKYQELLP